MSLRFSWSYELRGPAALWVASGAFVAVGVLVAFVLPPILPCPPDPEVAPEPLRRLLPLVGGAFLTLGGIPLSLMFVGLVVRRRSPQNLHVWHWWVKFLGALLGALAFAVPSSLLFPVFWMMHQTRPNALFPDEGETTHNLLVALLFSAIGWIALVGIYFVGRSIYRNRPRVQAGTRCPSGRGNAARLEVPFEDPFGKGC